MKMAVAVVLRLLFPPPSSVFVTAMTVISATSSMTLGWMEIRGKHVKYSKFWNDGDKNKPSNEYKKMNLSGRNGMLIVYAPTFVVGLASFVLLSDEGLRFKLLTSALAIHFFKRLLEVLFVHKYSGYMNLEVAGILSCSYFLTAMTMIYAQYLSRGYPDPPIDLEYVGIAIFLTGIIGNFYHHYLLSKLRKEGDKGYKIPQGGLFGTVICPHYVFEILGFIGVSCISQTLYAFSFTLGSTFYLMGRSYATRKWYMSKFEDFPKDVKALIPYIF